MLDVGVGAWGELIGQNFVPGNGLERERPHKLPRVTRHHGDDIVTLFLQAARHFDGLVGADAAGNAEGD